MTRTTAIRKWNPVSKSELVPTNHWPLLLPPLLLFCVFSVHAQIDMGGVTGTVKDPSGAVVPGAQCTLTNIHTGVSQRVNSTSTGTYTFEAVPIGTYDLRVTMSGFKEYLLTGVLVQIQKVVTADVKLQLGAVSQQVTVTSAAPLLEAQDATVGMTINSAAIADLPLVNNNWDSLPQLAPGTTTTNGAAANSGNDAMVNGDYWNNMDFRLNGIDDNLDIVGGLNLTPVPGSIEEIGLQAANSSAQFGFQTGEVINVVLRSGTNQLHGSLFEYLHTTDFNANSWANNHNHVAITPDHQNQFGGTIGGPVYIPGIYDGRNRTFFFADYQGDRQVLPVSWTTTVPTLAMQQSGFTNLQTLITDHSGDDPRDALGRLFPHGTVLDPATTRQIPANGLDPITGLTGTPGAYVRDPFYDCSAGSCPADNYQPGGPLTGITNFTTPGEESLLNILPASRIDPNAVALLRLLPDPTTTGMVNDYYVAKTRTVPYNQYDIRIDELLNSNNRLTGTFSQYLYYASPSAPYSIPADGALDTDYSTNLNEEMASLTYTHIFSPTLTNALIVGYNRHYAFEDNPDGDIAGEPAQFGIQGVQPGPGNGGMPAITVAGITAYGSRRYMPDTSANATQDYTDNLTKLYGGHMLKFGFEYLHLRSNVSSAQYPRGSFDFSGQYSDVPNKNSGFLGIADMVLAPTTTLVPAYGGISDLGGLSSYNASNVNMHNDNFRNIWGAYAQDRWKVTPFLTVNYGGRWDYFSPYGDKNGELASFDMAGGNGDTGTFITSVRGCLAPESASFTSILAAYNISTECMPNSYVYKTPLFNFSPRVGFDYRIRPRLVVRAGYSLIKGDLAISNYLSSNYPFVYTLDSPSTNSQLPLELANSSSPTGYVVPTFENVFNYVNYNSPLSVNADNIGTMSYQFNYKIGYNENANLAVQWQFTNHDSIQVGFVGNYARHLTETGSHNDPTELLPPGVNEDNYVPMPDIGRGSYYTSSDGMSSYNSLQVTYEHRFQQGLNLQANYTWGKCMTLDANQLGAGFRGEWLKGFGTHPDYTLCSADAAQVIHSSAELALPVGRNQRFLNHMNIFEDAAIGGWQFNYIYTYQSGQPVSIGCPVATSTGFGCDANLVPDENPYAGPHNSSDFYNIKAFSQPPTVTTIGQMDFAPLGSAPYQVRGSGFYNIDASMFKGFRFRRYDFILRADAFNLLNNAQFATPGQLNFTDATQFSAFTGTRSSRTMDVAANLRF